MQGRYEFKSGSSDKFYVIWKQPNGLFTLAWGKNGRPTYQDKQVDQPAEKARQKYAEKIREGYTFVSKETGFAEFDQEVEAVLPPVPDPSVPDPAVGGVPGSTPRILSEVEVEVRGVRFPRYECPSEFRSLIPEFNPWFRWTDEVIEVLFDLHPATTVLKGAAKVDHRAARNVLLAGHTGTGKTEIVRQICSVFGHPLIRVNCNGQLLMSDFVGSLVLKAGAGGSYTEFLEGALPKCLRFGFTFLVDEIDYADPEILGGVNSVLEPDGKLFLKEKGDELVPRHPWFRVAATANTVGCMEAYRDLYQGTKTLNAAFLNRWDVHVVNYMKEEEEVTLLRDRVPKLKFVKIPGKVDAAQALVRTANEIRTGFLNGKFTVPISTRQLLRWAEKTVRLADPQKAMTSTILNQIADQATREGTLGIARRILG